MYESIDYVLGSYFSPVLEFSEDEGISRLKEVLKNATGGVPLPGSLIWTSNSQPLQRAT